MRRYTIRFVVPNCDAVGEEHRISCWRCTLEQAKVVAQVFANKMYPNNHGIDVRGSYEGKRSQF